MSSKIRQVQITYSRIRAVAIGCVAVMLVILVSIGLGLADRFAKLNEARHAIDQSVAIRSALHAVLDGTVDAETGLRGFVITGKERYLDPYNAAVPTVKVWTRELHEQIENDPDQIKQLAILENLLQAKLAFLKKLMDLRRAYGIEAARQLILTDVGNNYMEQIRSVVAQMLDRENKHLIKHTSERVRAARHSIIGLIFLCVLAVMFIIVLGLALRNFVIAEKKVKELLIDTIDEYELLLSGVKDYALYMLDPQGTVITWNETAGKIKGYTAEEILGKNFSCFYPKEEQAKGKPMGQLDIAARTGKCEEEGPHLRKDGSKFWANVNIRPIYGHTGLLVGFTEVTHDISERKDAERRVSEFYSMISHELRTPLTSIRGTLGLMEGGRLGPLPERAKQLTRLALSESERLTRLVNDLLDIKKIEAGMVKLQFQELLSSEIITTTFEDMQNMADRASIKLISQVNTVEKVFGDRDHIVQVLTNLISNAIKFSPPSAEVLIQVDNVAGDVVRFSVMDKGPGIPQGELCKLFGKFQQLDSSDSRMREGTGLGLAISKAIVEQHGGRIGVHSVVGQGSTFWFELPCKKGVIIPETPDLRYKILLVDDDHNLCSLLSEMLTREGFAVDVLSTLKEAQQYLAVAPKPDVVLLDVKLPDGNGLELFERLRKNAKTHNTPVVVLTGPDPDRGTYAHPLLIDWIKKPFEEQRLLSALQLAVRVRSPGRARVLVIDSDQTTRELIKQELQMFDVDCFEAADGIEAINLARTREPDLIILDLALGPPDDFAVVEILRQGEAKALPLLVYTARDLNENDKLKLTLGLTAHLTKSRASQQEFLDTVRDLLDGLLKDKANPNTATAGKWLSSERKT